MKRLILAVVLGASALMAFALPTVEDVQAEVAKGNYTQAEEMMRGVVQARPGSARAHYVYAEILAHDRRYEQAAEQAARAKAIDPTLQFTQPDRFRAFEQLLERQRTAAVGRSTANGGDVAVPALQQPAAATRSGGVPGWVWAVGLAAAALLAWRVFGGRRQPAVANGTVAATPGMGSGMAAAGTPAAGSPMAGYGPGYGAPYPPAAPGSGRNWLGTGLAAAGGVAAGMMAERMLESHRDTGQGVPSSSADAPGLRGMAPGLLGGAPADGDIQRDLDQRPVDFGTGDEWGGDTGAGDSSPSGGDDGW